MIYEFQNADGRVIERQLPAAEAPKVGTPIVVDGVVFKRIASVGTSSPPVWKPYISSRLPRNLEGCDCTPQGKPIINSQAKEREVCARLGWERE